MKRFAGLVIGVLLGFVALTPRASAGLFLYGGELNEVLYNNYENLYDSSGNLRSADSTPSEGDYLAGIFQVNRINNLSGGGSSNIPDVTAFTGAFAQRITSVSSPGPGVISLTFGNPLINTFNASGDNFTLSDLGPTKMFAVYKDPVSGGTPFTFQGLLASNVASATDGSLLLTAGLDPSNPSNVAIGNAFFVLPPIPFGTATASLTIVDNNTGFSGFDPVTFAGLTGELVIRSRFDPNTDSKSKWEFTSFDPAELQPVIPEVSSLLMLGMGLSGLGIFSRKKFLV